MPRKPLIDPNLQLTDEQEDVLFGTILTDAWLEMQKGAKNARYGISISDTSQEFVMHLFKIWTNFVPIPKTRTHGPVEVWKTPPKSTTRFLQWVTRRRTGSHPAFTKAYDIFYPEKNQKRQKTVPAVSYLKTKLSYRALAYMIMCDGSIKSSQNKGIEIHLQAFSEEAIGRLCIALKEVLNITCKPSKEVRNKKVQYNLYICGENIDILIKKVKPFMLPSMQYKIPLPRTKQYTLKNISECEQWYEQNKNALFREII